MRQEKHLNLEKICDNIPFFGLPKHSFGIMVWGRLGTFISML